MSTRLDTEYPKQFMPENNTSEVEQDPKMPIPPQQAVEISAYKVPTVIIDLPSKGLVYSKDHPLSAGTIEIKYMTAKEEDILSTESFIRNGTVIERFLQSIIITPGVSTNDMVIGDIDALTVAARVYGYGHDYEVNVETPSGGNQKVIVDLSKLVLNTLDEETVAVRGVNEFDFKLPTGTDIKFKLLTQKDQTLIQADLKRQSKASVQSVSTTASTQLKYQIVAVNGVRDRRTVNDFVDNYLLASDARALRRYMESIQPGIDLSVEVTDIQTGEPFQAPITIGVKFFWPDARVSN
jgi:hypothetical protein